MLLKTCVWSIAMYGWETWTIGEAERKRLKALEMCDEYQMDGQNYK